MFYQLTWNFNHSPLTVEKLSVQHKATATKKEKEYCTIFEQRRMMQWKNIHIEEQVPMFTHPEGWFEFTRKSSYSSVWVTVRCAHLTLLCCRAQQHRHCCCSAEKWSEHNSPSGVYRMKPKMLCMQILSRIHKCWSPRAFAFFAQLLIQPHCSQSNTECRAVAFMRPGFDKGIFKGELLKDCIFDEAIINPLHSCKIV